MSRLNVAVSAPAQAGTIVGWRDQAERLAADVAADRRRRIIAIVGSSSGNLVEWYDFYCYAFFALYFAPAFFPHGDPTSQLLQTAGIFAIGFFMRPIGGWLFGRIADRAGGGPR